MILLVALDIVQVTVTPVIEKENPPPIEVTVVPLVKLEPPPPPKVQARVEPPQRPEPPTKTRTLAQPRVQQNPVAQPKVDDKVVEPDPGGAPVVQLDETVLGGKVPVGVGKRTTGRIGQGGTGTGTGAGSGAGSGEAPPPPVSVATIKQRALPKGDYGYFDAGRDYPAGARQRGIEGVIRVRLVVDDQGKVKSAVLLNKLGYGLDELALERSKKIEFVPAKDTDDKPVTSVVVWTFNMTLPK